MSHQRVARARAAEKHIDHRRERVGSQRIVADELTAESAPPIGSTEAKAEGCICTAAETPGCPVHR